MRVRGVRIMRQLHSRYRARNSTPQSRSSHCSRHRVSAHDAHLRRAILEYTNHYHEERNHQELDNELIVPSEAANGVRKVSRRERLGGLFSFYYREAA